MIALLWAPMALAWQGAGWDWTWQDPSLTDTFSLNVESWPEDVDRDNLEAMYLTGLAIWNGESHADLYVPYGGLTSETTYGGGDDDVNVSVWFGQDFGSALAQARYNTTSKGMIDCDIRFYGKNLLGTIEWSYDLEGAPEESYDWLNTMVHESGHCLGLGHSDLEDAVMYGYNGPGTGWEARHLHSDDIAGIQNFYGEVEAELELTVEVSGGEGLLNVGDVVEITAKLANPGDGHAITVTGQVEAEGSLVEVGGPQVLGDLFAGEETGTLRDELVFEVEVVEAPNEDREVELTVSVEAVGGQTAKETVTVELKGVTGGDDGGGGDGTGGGGGDGTEDTELGVGCGCDGTGGVGPGWAVLGLALLVGRRRR